MVAGSRLEWAATVFAAAVIVHNGDHLRRGADSVHTDVFVVGLLAIVLEVAIVAAVFARRRWAPVRAVERSPSATSSRTSCRTTRS